MIKILTHFITSLILLIGIINVSMGKIYKYKQPDGSILLTDTPSKGAEQVEYNENTWSSTTSQRADVQKILDDSRNINLNSSNKDNKENNLNKKDSKDSESRAINILYPTQDTYIRNGLGELIVKTNAKLQENEAIKVSLDGDLNENLYDKPSFLLKAIDRGEHTLLVSIVNKANGNIISTSDPVKFYMNRNIIRQNRPLGVR